MTKSKEKKNKVRFIVYTHSKEIIVTTPKLEKKMLQALFGFEKGRWVDESEYNIPKKYRDEASGHRIFDRTEKFENEVLIYANLDVD